jgi:hypothetical protein
MMPSAVRQCFNHAYQPDDHRERTGNSAQTSSYTVDTNWYADTGASDHLTSNLNRLHVHERYTGKDQVQVANGTGLKISHIGHSELSGSTKPLVLTNVLHVPHISKHLMSVHKLVSDNNAFAEFHPDFFCVKDKATKRFFTVEVEMVCTRCHASCSSPSSAPLHCKGLVQPLLPWTYGIVVLGIHHPP